MSDRLDPAPDLVAQIMFASDRTCCVCRDRTRKKVQLHHIDGDSSNTVFANLAVLCLDCHSDTLTKHAFARNLTPELVRLYNTAWREIVRGFLMPNGSEGTLREYTQEVLQELGLIPHAWKNVYFTIRPGGWSERTGQTFADVWEMLEAEELKYTDAVWQAFMPLFRISLDEVIDRLERTYVLHADVIPVRMKIALVRTVRTLRTEQAAYSLLPSYIAQCGDQDKMFTFRFKSVFHSFTIFCRLADSQRSAIGELP